MVSKRMVSASFSLANVLSDNPTHFFIIIFSQIFDSERKIFNLSQLLITIGRASENVAVFDDFLHDEKWYYTKKTMELVQ